MIKLRDMKLNLNSWSVLSFFFIILIILPNINILANIMLKPNENWLHIKEFLLEEYIVNSIILVIFTGIFTVLIGVSSAWFITIYDFPFRKFFEWTLILPLAIPPYIAAYTYNGILNYTGVVQSFLRNYLKVKIDPTLLDIMTIRGAIFIFTIFLFPYVYIITKAFLEKQSASLIEAARVLGRSTTEIFWQIILPISRGAIIGGVSLVILEVLNDYGVVKYFGIPTFSTAIFKTWFAMGDLDSAVRLASILMFLVFGLLILEKFLRGRQKFSYSSTKIRPISRKKLTRLKGMIVSAFYLLILSLGFFIPTLQLIHWSFLTYRNILTLKFLKLILNSSLLALLSSGIIIVVAVIIANTVRQRDSWVSKIYAKIAIMGYSIPGAVIAIGVIVFFLTLDKNLYPLYKMINENSGKLVLSTSIVMLIFAYLIRFLSISYNSIEAGFEKVGTKFSEASRTLGRSLTQTFFQVDLKMIKSAILGGFLLVFVDILKELPLTLILRPFNFDTLATKAYEYAADEMIQESAIASLLIIFICVISIFIFTKVGAKEE